LRKRLRTNPPIQMHRIQMSSEETDFRKKVLTAAQFILFRFSQEAEIQIQLRDLAIDKPAIALVHRKVVEKLSPILRADQIKPGVHLSVTPSLMVLGKVIEPTLAIEIRPGMEAKLERYVIDEIPLTEEERKKFDQIKDKIVDFFRDVTHIVVAEVIVIAITRALSS